MSAAPRVLIVNADDFGQSAGINAGIIEAHARGIVTSASLMVRWPAARAAVELAGEHPRLGLGLHLDLGEWAYQEERWVPLYEVVKLDDAAAVRDEVARQVMRFRELVGRDPDHIDSHQHVHRADPVRAVVCDLARGGAVPVRHCTAGVQYRGDFYGQCHGGDPYPEAIRVESLVRWLEELPAGITELACHPGDASDLETMYASERAVELTTLCDPRVRGAIERAGIRLHSFADVAGGLASPC